jgi:hypothetical protein
MATIDPNNLGRPVVTRNFTFLDLAMRAWGSEFHAPDHGIYEFSNCARKDSTDKTRSGLYGVDVPDVLFADDNYPDMRTEILVSTSGDSLARD